MKVQRNLWIGLLVGTVFVLMAGPVSVLGQVTQKELIIAALEPTRKELIEKINVCPAGNFFQ